MKHPEVETLFLFLFRMLFSFLLFSISSFVDF